MVSAARLRLSEQSAVKMQTEGERAMVYSRLVSSRLYLSLTNLQRVTQVVSVSSITETALPISRRSKNREGEKGGQIKGIIRPLDPSDTMMICFNNQLYNGDSDGP